MGQIGPILPQKEIFWKNDSAYFFLSIVPHHATNLHRNPQKVNETSGSIILAQIGFKLLKEDLWENWPMLTLSVYGVPSCQNFSKNLCHRPWDIRLNHFGPNWAQILLLLEKGIFLGKLNNTTIVYILCPILLQFSKTT